MRRANDPPGDFTMPIRASTLRTLCLLLFTGSFAGVAESQELPLHMPSFTDDQGNEIKSSLSLEGAFFPQSQSWFGKSKDNLGETSNYWFEQVAKLAVEGQHALADF